jgi:uncharacterized YccA/Bax inhibitor family protein
MMRTSNPVLNDQVFRIEDRSVSTVMTLEGTATKTLVLLGIAVVVAAIVWSQTMTALQIEEAVTIENAGRIKSLSVVPGLVWAYFLLGLVGGLIVALITCFKVRWSPVTAPTYAALEGLFLGAFSAMFQYMYPGIVLQAVVLTFGIFAALLLAYRLRLVRATENFKLGEIAAPAGILLVYLVSFVLGLFGVPMPFLHETGWLGIGFSLFVVVIAALNLVLDFDFVENGVAHGAPKYMEWYAGFGLLVTLIWLYIEIVRLLAKLRSRD